ncbi:MULTISPECIES: Cdc6/Cdc18 family protein [Natrialbaceae]|uniref:Cdc6/Cdc18 family protein n=1 Tax=Natrialbaceae TaxID=1644061 RepID=UPI00207C7F99|nr:AAA family ATPase [Natronococcus sp. CG52]
MDTPFRTRSHKTEPNPLADIFETREPFTEGFIPNRIVEPEEEFQQLVFTFQEYVSGMEMKDIFVYGRPGVGKRTVVKHLIRLVRDEIDKEINVVTIDCRLHSTIYQIYIELANSLTEERYKEGYPEQTLLTSAFSQIEKSDTPHYILVENMEHLSPSECLFYEFETSWSEYGSPDNELGVIGFSNENKIRDALLDHSAKRLLSRAQVAEIKFHTHDSQHLNDILELHADIAFVDDVLNSGVIPKCGAIAAQLTGSAKTALQLLELSGYIASQLDEKEVTEDHVELAKDALEELEVFLTFTQNLSIQEQLLCVLITVDNVVTGERVTSKKLYKEYIDDCEVFNLDPVSKRRVRDYIHTLEDNHLVTSTEHNTGRRKGKWYEYHLLPHPKPVVEAAVVTAPQFERILQQKGATVGDLNNDAEFNINLEHFTMRSL